MAAGSSWSHELEGHTANAIGLPVANMRRPRWSPRGRVVGVCCSCHSIDDIQRVTTLIGKPLVMAEIATLSRRKALRFYGWGYADEGLTPEEEAAVRKSAA